MLTEEQKKDILQLMREQIPDHSHTLDKVVHSDLLNLEAHDHDNAYLYKENTDTFTPDADHEPATKKYVDDNKYGLYAVTNTQQTILGVNVGTLWSVTITGGDLTADGLMRIRLHITKSWANDASWIIVSYGGSVIMQTTNMINLASFGDVFIDVYNRNATGAQYATGTFFYDDGVGARHTQLTKTTLAVDSTLDKTLLVQGDNAGVGTRVHLESGDIQIID